MATLNPLRTYADAVAWLTRYLIKSAYNMADGSVRPANQTYPTGAQDAEFATVAIISDEADLAASVRSTANDTTVGSTKVEERIDTYHEFTASVQFFKHSAPVADAAGLSPVGLGAFDKASRLQIILAMSRNMETMERIGFGFLGASPARNLSSLIDGATWEDRGSVDLYFCCYARETDLLETIATVEVDIKAAWPSGRIDTRTIEVTP